MKGLRGAFTGGEYDAKEIMPLDEPWPILPNAVLGQLNYTGPYFISCDHGCFHSSPHGIGIIEDIEEDEIIEKESGLWREKTIQWCIDAIKRSDIIFAWIDDTTCYGTLTEIGYAKALGKTIWIAGTNEQLKDLWFAYNMANKTLFGEHLTPKGALELLIKGKDLN